ncbi:hypothetical protein GCM10009527_023080 [Actinomadura nitritigenes]
MPSRYAAIASLQGSDMLVTRDPGDEAMEFIRMTLHGHLVFEPPTVAGGLRVSRLGPMSFSGDEEAGT